MSRMSETHMAVNSKTSIGENSPADMEVFNEIDQIYFTGSETFDPARYILENMPALTDCNLIEELFIRLKRQQQVVSNKALHLISQKTDACHREFKAITEIQILLNGTIDTCRDGRKELGKAKSNLTVSTFGILANFRKRQIVQALLKSLNMIKNLRQAEDDVQNLIRNKEYEAAVRLVLTAKKQAADHKHFKCVQTLRQRLQDTLDLAEEQLDVVLASICYNFDMETFTKLQKAYALLDKTQVAMDQLHMHFASAINISALEALKAHQKETADGASNEQAKLKDLCAGVREPSVVLCLLDLCDRLWLIMLSYHRVVEWHNKQDEMASDLNENKFEENVNKEYVRQKLKNGLTRIWHDVQSKVSTFLVQSGLLHYPFEKFVQVLGILKRLIDVAEEFCGDTSDGLQSFIKTHSLTYLKNYHAGRMDVLRIFLENESWELCPVRSSFNLLQMQEFDKIKRHIKSKISLSNKTSPVKDKSLKTIPSDAGSSTNSQDDSCYVHRYFTRNSRHTPFHIFRSDINIAEELQFMDLENDSVGNSSGSEDEEELEELTRDFVDENPTNVGHFTSPKHSKHSISDAVIVTNTTLSVLRDCGQYLQMCRFLKPISFEVIMLMSQMFDYYLYAVHLFFTADLKVSSSTLYSPKLNSMLKRIGNNLASAEELESENSTEDSDEKIRNTKTLKPVSSQIIDLNNPENLHGLTERIVAVESLIFLAKQLEILQPYLENLVSPHQRIILQTFYEQTVSAACDLRVPIYMCVASQAFNVRNILISMSQVNWEVKNVRSQHSPYVDYAVRDIQVFSMRLDQISERVPISSDVQKSVWTAISKFIIHTLVEGFSNVSKCSDSGRGLMQLDYTQLLSKLEKISSVKPVPFFEYVDTYVKAFYMTKEALEGFVKEHPEYSNKHLISLVNCTCEGKKSRQELIYLIENRDNLARKT